MKNKRKKNLAYIKVVIPFFVIAALMVVSVASLVVYFFMLPNVDVPELLSKTISISTITSETIEDLSNFQQGEVQAIGIDVSEYQGKIDWSKVAENGVSFAMIRCGYRGYADGSLTEDKCFQYNIENALANNIDVGIYIYSTAKTTGEAIEEANWVVDKIRGYDITYPVVYDTEEFYNKGYSRIKNLSRSQRTNNTIAFLETIKDRGYIPMLYASTTAIQQYWEYSRVYHYDFWLAHYIDSTNYDSRYEMWQCTSNGKVDGITGYVDINFCYKKY